MSAVCRGCSKILNKNWQDKNKIRVKEYRSSYSKANSTKISVTKKLYYENNKDKIRVKRLEYVTRKLNEDINFKIVHSLRGRLRKAVKCGYKTGSAVQDLGCSITYLKQHLEERFRPGMSWDNWGVSGWHIDHIKPLASFDLTDRRQFLEACHYTNLQPLWAKDNICKGATI